MASEKGNRDVRLMKLSKNPVVGFPGGPVVKNLPASAGTEVQSQVREDPTRSDATKPACQSY